MKIAATHTGKRKAVDTVEYGIEGDVAKALKEYIKRSEERFELLEQSVTKLIDEGGKKSQDTDDEQEDWSDGEESDTNDSDPWTIMFLQLRDYRILHGDCRVSRKFKENPKLGIWVNNQRVAFRNVKTGKKGRSITADNIVKLDSIGFDWGKGYPPPQSWDEMFAQLQNYQQKMGNCNVPFNAKNPSPLAKWAAYQRAEYKRFKQGRHSLLTLDQIGKLKEIKFNWKGPRL